MADNDREGLEHTGYRSGQVRIVGAEPGPAGDARAPRAGGLGRGVRR